MTTAQISKKSTLPAPFWVVWAIELWERFGYYGTQAILAVYFVQQLGYSQQESFYTFGSFAAFVYGFVWIGGLIGDKYLGSKRTVVLGATVLMISYFALSIATKETVFFALAGVVIGNALFKANPSSLISKLYKKGDPALDGAMTMYYMAINIGSFISMALTPIIAIKFGWGYAFAICGVGLLLGLFSFFAFYKHIAKIGSEAGKQSLRIGRLFIVIAGIIVSIIVVGFILPKTSITYSIVVIVVAGGFLYFVKIAFSLHGKERARMLIAFVLILQGTIFFVLYNQMPTSLTFFAEHNINNLVLGFNIPAAEYQVLNPLVIVIASPLLALLYVKFKSTHITKFCIGMSLCALAFLVLWIPQFTATAGKASPLWMVLTYALQSTGELLISGLGLAMVAELCPRNISGFVMGVWFLGSMLAGPIGAWVGSLTAPPSGLVLSATESIHVYGNVFVTIGIVTAVITLLMWAARPYLNRIILGAEHKDDGRFELLEEAHV